MYKIVYKTNLPLILNLKISPIDHYWHIVLSMSSSTKLQLRELFLKITYFYQWL